MKLKIIAIIVLLFIESLSGSQDRKGLYVGLGAGYRSHTALILPIEIGYGVTNDLLVHLSHSSSISLITESLSGLGVSYYMNDKVYLQAIAGNSYYGFNEYSFDAGLGFSLGLGLIASKRTSIELSYMHLDFDNAKTNGEKTNNIEEPLDMFSVAFKYRLF